MDVLNSFLDGMHSLTDAFSSGEDDSHIQTTDRKRRISLMHGFFGEAEKNRQKMLVQVQEAKVIEQSTCRFYLASA